LKISEGKKGKQIVTVYPANLAAKMNEIAVEESLADEGKPFTSAKKVGGQLKRLRFRRPAARNARGKAWETTCEEIEAGCRVHGITEEEDSHEDPNQNPEPDSDPDIKI
jgi:hypothetical protein